MSVGVAPPQVGWWCCVCAGLTQARSSNSLAAGLCVRTDMFDYIVIRIVLTAAETTGIGLTLLPVLYSYGGAQKQVLAGGQLRFGNDVSQYLELVDGARKAVSRLQDGRVGIAPHSLRASSPEDLVALLAAVPAGPVHMHIAEQPAEVEQIEAWLGARPVAWALDNLDVDARWCMIHATHMTQAETKMRP